MVPDCYPSHFLWWMRWVLSDMGQDPHSSLVSAGRRTWVPHMTSHRLSPESICPSLSGSEEETLIGKKKKKVLKRDCGNPAPSWVWSSLHARGWGPGQSFAAPMNSQIRKVTLWHHLVVWKHLEVLFSVVHRNCGCFNVASEQINYLALRLSISKHYTEGSSRPWGRRDKECLGMTPAANQQDEIRPPQAPTSGCAEGILVSESGSPW